MRVPGSQERESLEDHLRRMNWRAFAWARELEHQITCARTRRTALVTRRKYLARKGRRR